MKLKEEAKSQNLKEYAKEGLSERSEEEQLSLWISAKRFKNVNENSIFSRGPITKAILPIEY